MTTATAIQIKKVELKSIKVHLDVSEETICYSANIYANGKKVGSIDNAGRGGCSMMDTSCDKELRAWSKKQPDEIFLSRESFDEYDFGGIAEKRGDGPRQTYEEYMAEHTKSPEDLFDHIAYETYETKRMNRQGKKSIHFRLPDTRKGQWVFYRGLEYNEQNLEWLRNKEPELTEIYNPTKAIDFGLVY
jgi:hypothetical protein